MVAVQHIWQGTKVAALPETGPASPTSSSLLRGARGAVADGPDSRAGPPGRAATNSPCCVLQGVEVMPDHRAGGHPHNTSHILGYAGVAGRSIPGEVADLNTHCADVLPGDRRSAGLFTAGGPMPPRAPPVSGCSTNWHMYLYTYLAIALSFAHQFSTGTDFPHTLHRRAWVLWSIYAWPWQAPCCVTGSSGRCCGWTGATQPPRDGRSPGIPRHRLRLPHRACLGPARRTARPVLPLAICYPRPVVGRHSVLTVSPGIRGRTADHRPHDRPPQQPAEDAAGRHPGVHRRPVRCVYQPASPPPQCR